MRALIFAEMCRLRKTIVLHVCAHRLSVTHLGKWKRSWMLCVVVFSSEWNM